MRMCRTLLTVFIAIGLHVSLCTGGIFALATSVSDYVAYSSSDDSGPMSYGAIGYLSCESGKKSDDRIGVHIGGCDQRDTCLSQAGSILEERSLFESISSTLALLPVGTTSVLSQNEPEVLHRYTLARAGPLYEQAPYFAHSLIKIE